MTPLRFTTNAYPKEQRRDAWRFALSRSSLILDQIDETALYGELIQFRSSTGINFLRVTGTPQSWSIDFREQPGFLLAGHDAAMAQRRCSTRSRRTSLARSERSSAGAATMSLTSISRVTIVRSWFRCRTVCSACG